MLSEGKELGWSRRSRSIFKDPHNDGHVDPKEGRCLNEGGDHENGNYLRNGDEEVVMQVKAWEPKR